MIAAETSQQLWCTPMTSENREMDVEELAFVTGGGIVDTVFAEAEATTDAFLKRFAEASLRFNAFINTPGPQGPAVNQE
jgi:hypothetical protein